MLRKMLIVVAALVVATGGTATAAKLITGKDVRNGSLTGKDIKNKSLGVSDLSSKARSSLRGQTGATGAAGLPGAAGAAGAKGETGLTGPTGPKGDAGAKGDKGDQGIQGIQGIQGEQGEQGETGPSSITHWRAQATSVIDDENDSRRAINLMNVAAGPRAFTAKLVIKNNGATVQNPTCALGWLVGDEMLFNELDSTMVTIQPGERAEFVLVGAVTLPSTRPVVVDCTPNGNTYDISINQRSLLMQIVGKVHTI